MPLRRTTLHFEQIGLTDDLTFICVSSLFEPIRDTSAGEIIRRQFDRHLIARQNSDEMHAHFSGNMRENLVTIIQLHSEHCIGERFSNRPLNLDDIFLRH